MVGRGHWACPQPTLVAGASLEGKDTEGQSGRKEPNEKGSRKPGCLARLKCQPGPISRLPTRRAQQHPNAPPVCFWLWRVSTTIPKERKMMPGGCFPAPPVVPDPEGGF